MTAAEMANKFGLYHFPSLQARYLVGARDSWRAFCTANSSTQRVRSCLCVTYICIAKTRICEREFECAPSIHAGDVENRSVGRCRGGEVHRENSRSIPT